MMCSWMGFAKWVASDLVGFATGLKKSEFQNPSQSLILSIRVPNLSRILEGSGMGGSKLVIFHSSIKPFVFSPTGQMQDHNINLKLWKNTYWGSEIVTTWCLSCFFSEGYYLGYLCLCITHHAYHCLFQNLWITGIFMLVKSVVQFDWFAESGKPTKLVASFAPTFLHIYHLYPTSHGSVNHRPLHTSVVCGGLWLAESGKSAIM